MTTVQKTTARRLRKGFTLLEILIAVAIVGMLVVIVGAVLTSRPEPAR